MSVVNCIESRVMGASCFGPHIEPMFDVSSGYMEAQQIQLRIGFLNMTVD